MTILGELALRCPEQIGPSVRRTLERRISAWKALHGPARDVIFPQVQGRPEAPPRQLHIGGARDHLLQASLQGRTALMVST